MRRKIPIKNINKCLVLFHPRSGSSWLIKILQENKNFRAGYEIFGSYQYESDSPTALEQEQLLNNFYNCKLDRSITTWNNKKGRWNSSKLDCNIYDTIVCKISPYQVIDKPFLIKFIQENKIKVICLTRKDIVRRAVSEYRSDILSQKIGTQNITKIEDNYILGSTKIEKADFFSFLDRSLAGLKDVSVMADLLAENNVNIFHLTYENLLKDTNSSLQELEDFLGSKIKIRQTEKIIKITDDNLQSSVSNYEELQEWVDEYLSIKT
ncbi:sulfotransferase family protein [Xenococcus sp. PCC 7305]|uniref:sulfotransferase domain-containing protein n=1 Tax=Xenococcus sp. PCC 7305 TaxID=102125 RepID=UPI0002AC9D29|nr:sulfotransferase domain-containing protein [Xenococcus sp. PCC 7305]ELS03406.1 sulfotransferase family protein [Xenococcus sp. PCC 7305]